MASDTPNLRLAKMVQRQLFGHFIFLEDAPKRSSACDETGPPKQSLDGAPSKFGGVRWTGTRQFSTYLSGIDGVAEIESQWKLKSPPCVCKERRHKSGAPLEV